MNQSITTTIRRWVTAAGGVALTLLLSGVRPLTAQQTASPSDFPVLPGMRVRVVATGLSAPLIGSFLQQKGDTAIFIEDGVGRGVWSFVISDIVRIEQSIGQRRLNRSPMMRGALYGSGGGGVLAYAFSAFASPSDSGRKYSRAPTAFLGMTVGAVIGAAVGSRFTQEHWSPVAFVRRVSIAPSRRGATLAARLTF